MVHLVVHIDYDTYEIYGVYPSKEEAVTALKERGYRKYKGGDDNGDWWKIGQENLTIDSRQIGWQSEQ